MVKVRVSRSLGVYLTALGYLLGVLIKTSECKCALHATLGSIHSGHKTTLSLHSGFHPVKIYPTHPHHVSTGNFLFSRFSAPSAVKTQCDENLKSYNP